MAVCESIVVQTTEAIVRNFVPCIQILSCVVNFSAKLTDANFSNLFCFDLTATAEPPFKMWTYGRQIQWSFVLWACVAAALAHNTDSLTSQPVGPDVAQSLFSGLELGKLQELLKDVPHDKMQKLAGRVMGELNKIHTEDGKKNEFQTALLHAAKAEGLLGAWKHKLDALLFDDNAVPSGSGDNAKRLQAKVKEVINNAASSRGSQALPDGASLDDIRKAVHQMLGNKEDKDKAPATSRDSFEQEDLNYLFDAASDMLGGPSDRIQPPKEKIKKPSQSSYHDKKTKEQAKQAAKQKQDPMESIVGMAKQLLGHEDSDPTLNIIANMASAYMNNPANSKKNGNGPDLASMMQLASMFAGGAGNKKSKDSGPDLASMLQLASMFAGGANNKKSTEDNPLEMITSFLSNAGVDWSQLLEVGAQMLTPNQNIPSKRKHLSTSPIAELVIRLLANFLEMDPDFLVNYYNGLTQVVEANSWTEINTILRRSTGTDVETVLDSLANDDVRQQLSDSTTATLVHWLQHFVNPDSLNTRIIYLNAMLMQYNYPTVDAKNVIETFSEVIEKLSADYMSTKVDLRPYLKHFDQQLKWLLNVDPDDHIDFRKFSEAELSHAIEYTMKTEVFDPIAALWSDFRLASRVPKCARTILCRRNLPQATRSSFGLKEGVTRATR